MGCGPTSTEIVQIQIDANKLLDLPCTIQRRTSTKDLMGSATEVWNTIASVNVGMKQPSASLLQNYAARIGSLATFQVRLPSGTNVLEEDRLLIQGETLIVQAILTPQSYSIYVNLLAAKVG
jgi:head-tail adaptor